MKKIIFILFCLFLLNGCFQMLAFVGPAVTGATTGNIYQSAVSYSISYGVKKKTGKTVLENVLEATKEHKKISKNGKSDELILSFQPKIFRDY